MWKKIMVRSGFLSVFLFFSFFISCFLASSPSYAISDITYTFDFSSIPSWYDICQGSSDCSSYNYMFVEPSNPSSCSVSSYFYASGFGTANIPVSVCASSVFILSSSSHVYLTGGQSGKYSGDITITLSESYGSAPSGSITLTENGTFDVSSYATAVVNVPAEVIQGDYHDDLVNVVQAIYVCAGVMLVLYFFYCIYRLIIRNSGVK